MKKRSLWSNVIIIFFGAMGGLLFGYDTGIISSALVFLAKDFTFTDLGMSLVSSSILIGAVFGAPITGYFSDRLGRKKVVFCLGLIYTIGAVLSSYATNQNMLIFTRFILGLAVGGSSLLVPLYLSEMAPARIRGIMTSFNQLMIVSGIVLSSVIGYMFSFTGNWRAMFMLAIVPSIVMMIGMITMSESPRWLLIRNREDEARKVLLRTRTAEETEAEIKEIYEINKLESEGYKELKKPYMKPILVLGISILALQAFVGIDAILYYLPTIFVQMGVSDSEAILYLIYIGVVEMIMTVVGMLLIDKLGRRKLLLGGNVIMAISVLTLSISAHFGENSSYLIPITLACFCFFIAAFCVSWGAGAWVYVAEIFPLKVRGATASLAVCSLWLANFVVIYGFPIVFGSLGVSKTFLIFFGINVIAFLFVYFKMIETKGVSMEKIEQHFREMVQTGK